MEVPRAANGSWKRGVSTGTWRRREGKRVADKDAKRHPATHRMVEKLVTRPRAGSGTRNASGCPKRLMAGSKEVLGFRRFSVRGLAKARGEWDLVCLALNIKRLQPLLAV